MPEPDDPDSRRRSHELVLELYRRLDAGDVAGAVALYAEDATLLGARGHAAIEETILRGLAPHAHVRSRHVVTDLRARTTDGARTVVTYTALAFTLDGDDPGPPRSVLDQVQEHRSDDQGRLRIARHDIPDYAPPAR